MRGHEEDAGAAELSHPMLIVFAGKLGVPSTRRWDDIRHLHFGLFVDGIAVDPLPVLRPYAVRIAPPTFSNLIAASAGVAKALPMTP